MTTLELTNWTGVSKERGPFMIMFGDINVAATPDEMAFSMLTPAGREMCRGFCIYDSASSFDLRDIGQGELIPGDKNASCTYSIATDVLTITSGSYVLKALLA